MESKRHQKLYEHYKTVFDEEPIIQSETENERSADGYEADNDACF